MNSLQQAEELRQQAIALLLADKTTIEEKLAQLGYTNGDGMVTTEVKKDRKQKTCGVCHEAGHTSRTCKMATQAATI